jgi:lysophospholipase L1-like esterase
MILFVLFLEGFLDLGGWVFLVTQEYRNQTHAVSGSYRILCLGDSITANGGDYSYPSQLQYALNHAGSDIKFQVINRGTPSWTTSEMSDHFGEFIQKYHPDMVVFMVGVNDISFYTMVPVNQESKIKFLILDRIKVYKLLKKLWMESRSFGAGPEEKESGNDELEVKSVETASIPMATNLVIQEHKSSGLITEAILPKYYREIVKYHPLTIRNYNDMIELALNKGIKVMVMQYPMVNLTPLRDIIYLKDQVAFVDNEKIFKEAVGRQGSRQYFEDDYGHLTPEGASLLVSNLSKRILELLDPALSDSNVNSH